MSELDLRGLVMLVHLFTLMIYIGVVVIVGGVIVGLVLGGAAGAVVLSASLGAGGVCVIVGVRSRGRGKATLGRLQGGDGS